MNPILLYYCYFKNIKQFEKDSPGLNEAVFISRLPYIKGDVNPVLKKLLWIVGLIFEPLFSILFVTFYLVPFLYKSIVIKKTTIGNHLALIIGPLVEKRIYSAGLDTVVKDYLYGAFENNIERSKETHVNHSIFERLNPILVLKCYFLSLVAILCAAFYSRFSFVFRNYVSFEFFLYYYFFRNIPTEVNLYYAALDDRWAILFDNAPQTKKILLQHGIVLPDAYIPIKLRNTGILYAFSKQEADNVIRGLFVKAPKVYIMKPTIALSEIDRGPYSNSILIVGYPSYLMFDKESLLIKLLSNKCRLLLKAHPGKDDRQRYYDLQNKYNFDFIETDMFPDVDYVISYRSTLAVEYQAYGKSVFFYDEYTIEQMCNIIMNNILNFRK